MKTHRIASLVLAGAMIASSLTALAATAKKDAFTPDTALERLDNEFYAVVENVSAAMDSSDMSDEDAYALLDWVMILGAVYEATVEPLEDAAYVDEYRDELEEYSKDGSSILFKTTASLEQFTMTETETESDGTAWTYQVKFMRKLNRMTTDAVMTEKGKDTTTAALDYVVGEERIYIQLAAYNSSDKDTGDAIYDVVRVMVSDGEVYASMTQMDAKELQRNRITSVYPSFAAFAFSDGEVFAYDGMSVTVGDVQDLDNARIVSLKASSAA